MEWIYERRASVVRRQRMHRAPRFHALPPLQSFLALLEGALLEAVRGMFELSIVFLLLKHLVSLNDTTYLGFRANKVDL